MQAKIKTSRIILVEMRPNAYSKKAYGPESKKEDKTKKPNFIFFMADILGYATLYNFYRNFFWCQLLYIKRFEHYGSGWIRLQFTKNDVIR
jgi:hypothetical protein